MLKINLLFFSLLFTIRFQGQGEVTHKTSFVSVSKHQMFGPHADQQDAFW